MIMPSGSAVSPSSSFERDDADYVAKKRAQQVINVPTTITSLERGYLSSNVKVQSISLPSTVTYLGKGAFEYCSSLQSITLPNSIRYIGAEAFSGCRSLKTITIPESVFAIRANAFENCTSLQSIIIPGSLTYIEDYAFSYCTSLTSVVLPKELVYFGRGVFDACTALEQRNCEGCNYHSSAEKWLQSRFSGLPIHQACYENMEGMSQEKFMALLEEHSDTLHLTDAMGMTPLHVLHCNPTAPMNVRNMLKEASPNAIHAVNVNGMSPLMLWYACKSIQTSNYFDSVSNGPSLCALLQQGVELEDIQELMEYDENGTFLLEMEEGDSETGLYPFMSAASSTSEYDLDVIFDLILKFPDIFQRFS